MPENNEPTSTPSSTESPSSTAPTSGAPARYTAPAHSRFAGRSAEEILGIAEGLAAVAERFNQPVPQPQMQAPVNRFDLDLPDEEYLTGRQVKAVLQHYQNQQPIGDPVTQAQAAGALYLAMQGRFPDEFRRWESEIRAEAAKLPVQHWNLDTLTAIVKIVRSNHVDELAAEKAQRLVDESHPTIRSGSGGSGGVSNTQLSLDAEGIPAEFRAAARAQGITEAQVREFCQETGVSEEQYYKDLVKYGKGSMIRG